MGLVLTAGQDAQKNHSIGILRDDDDAFPFRNTPWFGLQEAYISGRIPIGNGPVLKLGKFVTLLGYEVIESPNNSGPSGTGQIAFTPNRDLATALSFTVGPEISGDRNPIRWVVDLIATYTGIKNFTFGFNFDYGWQQNDVFLIDQGFADDKRAQWYGIAAYAAYDFLKDFRVALRQEWFKDVNGVRSATPGGVTLFSTTATLQYNIWKGLYARGEYRHDNANAEVFGCRPDQACEHKTQDTLSVSLF